MESGERERERDGIWNAVKYRRNRDAARVLLKALIPLPVEGQTSHSASVASHVEKRHSLRPASSELKDAQKIPIASGSNIWQPNIQE